MKASLIGLLGLGLVVGVGCDARKPDIPAGSVPSTAPGADTVESRHSIASAVVAEFLKAQGRVGADVSNHLCSPGVAEGFNHLLDWAIRAEYSHQKVESGLALPNWFVYTVDVKATNGFGAPIVGIAKYWVKLYPDLSAKIFAACAGEDCNYTNIGELQRMRKSLGLGPQGDPCDIPSPTPLGSASQKHDGGYQSGYPPGKTKSVYDLCKLSNEGTDRFCSCVVSEIETTLPYVEYEKVFETGRGAAVAGRVKQILKGAGDRCTRTTEGAVAATNCATRTHVERGPNVSLLGKTLAELPPAQDRSGAVISPSLQTGRLEVGADRLFVVTVVDGATRRVTDLMPMPNGALMEGCGASGKMDDAVVAVADVKRVDNDGFMPAKLAWRIGDDGCIEPIDAGPIRCMKSW